MAMQPEDPLAVNWDALKAILKDSFFAHAAFVDEDGIPHCIPMIVPALRLPEDAEPFLYLHGHPSSPLMQMVTASSHSGSSVIVSIAATKIDGINLSSAPNGHSFNYRTVRITGSCSLGPTDLSSKHAIMQAVTNHIIPGRWDDVNTVSSEVLSLVCIIRVRVNRARIRIRQGGPNIQPGHSEVDGPDKPGGVWTGVIPVWEQLGDPMNSGKTPGTVMPTHLNEYVIERNRAQKQYATSIAVDQSTT